MRYSTVVLCASLVLVACQAQQVPIVISKVSLLRGTPTACETEPPGEGLVGLSLLDVAARDAEFWVWTELTGFEALAQATAQPPVQIGTRVLASAGRDRVRFDRVELRYTSKPTMPGVVNAGSARESVDTIPLALPPGAGTVVATVPLLGKTLVKAFNDLPPTTVGDSTAPTAGYDLSVTFQIVGSLTESATPIRTDAFSFPIRVVKSDVGSAPGAIKCDPNDLRLAPFNPGTAAGARACNYYGVGRRFGSSQCCSNAANNGQLGCEPL
jgi:hypothetical protein